MSVSRVKNIYVVGHRNPDTDSICSAISLAYLRNALNDRDDVRYVPVRAGHVNRETMYVLDTFKVEKPTYLPDARPQIADVDYSTGETASEEITIKKAWKVMRDQHKSTLAITDDAGMLKGMITTGDIAMSFMAVFDTQALSKANTPVINIIEALNGTLLVGDMDMVLTKGRIQIAAANTSVLRNAIEPGDVVILGNRYEAQLASIEEGASVIIVCEGAKVSLSIRHMAGSKGCAVISTPYDVYDVSRIINQSLPVGSLMDRSVLGFGINNYIEDIRETITKERARDFAIIDDEGRYIGMLSRRNLIDMDKKQFVLVDHNEEGQAMKGMNTAEVTEIVDHHKLGTLQTSKPVNVRNMPVGCTATIIYMMYMEQEVEIPRHIAGLLCSAIISDTLLFRSPTCTDMDRYAAGQLAPIAGIDLEAHAVAMFGAGSDLHSKSIDGIFYQDFKKFTAGDKVFGVGQITSMNVGALGEIKEQMKRYLPGSLENEGMDMVFFLMTDILKESSVLLMAGKDSEDAAAAGFAIDVTDGEGWLEGVVSRKKQFVPVMMEQLIR